MVFRRVRKIRHGIGGLESDKLRVIRTLVPMAVLANRFSLEAFVVNPKFEN